MFRGETRTLILITDMLFSVWNWWA